MGAGNPTADAAIKPFTFHRTLTVFQPDDATQTLRSYVRQRANLVRLSAHRRAKKLGYEVRKVEPPAPADAAAG
ncbi:hypothetical protein ETAA1_32700 [Urbifossiella limnaea]|uniref:Uncharacterized protein n=1 Tax=Urbifossiella limnaea TaxID=2528023 RepID=A0A517XUY1_9BACT|nr:hypothetical protein ETAA1_32700 [Urbifossiella limnaea]